MMIPRKTLPTNATYKKPTDSKLESVGFLKSEAISASAKIAMHY